MDLFTFWGKTDRSIAVTRYHPAICHMIDVGIVAKTLASVLRFRFGGLDLETLAFLCAMHDIGKLSPGFQGKDEERAELLKRQGHSFPRGSEKKHGLVAAKYLPELIRQAGCRDDDLAELLSYILAAHHGIFPGGVGWNCEIIQDDETWKAVRQDTMRLLSDLFPPCFAADNALPSLADSIRFAGLVTVADWLASNEIYFPYDCRFADEQTIIALERYAEERRDLANKALSGLHIGAILESGKAFFDMFQFPRNQYQEAVASVAQELTHPMLIIVETPMGSGKTEAALEAYSHIALKNGLRGMYYALPTQATSNPMFGRVENFIKNLDLSGGTEFHLLHANSDINPDYEKMLVKNVWDEEDKHPEGGVHASSWFTVRKRGLLADFGVGTIDQALMSVLKNRHFFVRSFGLSDKVVILDEVHAYDAYMTEEIACLVRWLLEQNTSVIILSATLPKSKRLKITGRDIPSDIQYPCVMGLDTNGNMVHKNLRGTKQAPVIMEPLVWEEGGKSKAEIARDLLDEKLAEGGCAACILNTVSDAQDLYRLVKESRDFQDVILFHGRFTVDRKEKIEEWIRSRYGKRNSDTCRPQKGLVIATQVLEQSLDVDFDLMISDLAPIDLLLQRAGRLHRHENKRPSTLRERVLYVLIPDMTAEKVSFGGSGFVYFPAILAKTGQIFLAEGDSYQSITVNIPDDVSALVEKVYDDSNNIEMDNIQFKTNFEQWVRDREGKELGQSYLGKQNTLGYPDSKDPLLYLSTLGNTWDEDTVAPSRLTKPSVRLVVVRDGRNLETLDHGSEKTLYAQSVVVDNNAVVKHYLGKERAVPDPWGRSPVLRNCYPLLLPEEGSVLDLGDVTVTYDDDYGLRVMGKRRSG